MWQVLIFACIAAASAQEFRTAYSWRQVDYQFPNDSVRNEYLASGDFVPENNMPLGLQLWNRKLFITVPRWKNGVVANLNYISLDDKSESPKLIPYPDWERNNIHSPDGIVSIFRVRVDSCNRLWGVDTGIDDILGNTTVVQPVRLFIIDLNTGKTLRIYQFKETDQKPESFFADLVVDVNPNDCENAHLYISDLSGYGIVVYSLAKNDSWRISHNYFYFDPLQGDYTISGINFQWTDGIFGMSLSNVHEDGYKTLYFHAMSGVTEFSVSTEVLQDDTLTKSQNYHAFHVEGNKGPKTQGPTSLIDSETGINYFSQVNKNGIACWDTGVKLDPTTFVLVAQNNETMVFPNDLTIDPQTRKLYTLSDNLPIFQYAKYNPAETNFFVTEGDLKELTAHCKRRESKEAKDSKEVKH